MIVAFDLDDTLYDESTFIKSGLYHVSKYLYEKYLIKINDSTNFFHYELSKGRARILDKLLLNYEIYTKKELRKCLSVYRSHFPDIHLYPEAIQMFDSLKNIPKYVVTDGNKIVQKNKIKALNLENYVKKIILTSNYGLRNSKPSTYCFQKICNMEKISPKNLVYIGDNPHKDFVGLKHEEFKTIRLFKGRFKNECLSKEFEADYKIKSLKEINEEFIKMILEN